MTDHSPALPGECSNCLSIVPVRHEVAYGRGGGEAISGLWCPACVRAKTPELMRLFFPDAEDSDD